MVKIEESINKTTNTFTSIMVLGLVGLLFLIVFGNLTGNLGFKDTTNSTINETGHFINATTITLTEASGVDFQSVTVTSILNATDGTSIGSGNYTVDSALGTVVGSAGRTSNWTTVLINYDSALTSTGEKDTNNVITNLSGGATTFFTFSNVWFTLLAVVLLIIIVMSVILVVQPKKSSFSS